MAEIIVMTAAGCSLVLDCVGPHVPRVLHWGRDLGPLDADDLRTLRELTVPPARPSSSDEPVWLTLLPSESDGWLGAPGLHGHRDGRTLLPRLVLRTLVGAMPTSVLATVGLQLPALHPGQAVLVQVDPVLP